MGWLIPLRGNTKSCFSSLLMISLLKMVAVQEILTSRKLFPEEHLFLLLGAYLPLQLLADFEQLTTFPCVRQIKTIKK